MKGWLTAIIAGLLAVVGFQRASGFKKEAKQAKAVSDTKTRQAEGLIEGQKKYDEVTKSKLDRDNFHRVRKYGDTQDTNTNTH